MLIEEDNVINENERPKEYLKDTGTDTLLGRKRINIQDPLATTPVVPPTLVTLFNYAYVDSEYKVEGKTFDNPFKFRFEICRNSFSRNDDFRLEVTIVNPNPYNYLQIDHTWQSLIKRLTIIHNSTIIEDITDYNEIANLIGDISINNYKIMSKNYVDSVEKFTNINIINPLYQSTQENLVPPIKLGNDTIFNPKNPPDLLDKVVITNGLIDYTPRNEVTIQFRLLSTIFGVFSKIEFTPLFLFNKSLYLEIEFNPTAFFVPVFNTSVQDIIKYYISDPELALSKSVNKELKALETLPKFYIDKYFEKINWSNLNTDNCLYIAIKSVLDIPDDYNTIKKNVFSQTITNQKTKNKLVDLVLTNYGNIIKLKNPQAENTLPRLKKRSQNNDKMVSVVYGYNKLSEIAQLKLVDSEDLFLSREELYNDYIENMSKTTWGGVVEIYLASVYYDINFVILYDNGDMYSTNTQTFKDINDFKYLLYLVNAKHYQGLTLKNNLKLSDSNFLLNLLNDKITCGTCTSLSDIYEKIKKRGETLKDIKGIGLKDARQLIALNISKLATFVKDEDKTDQKDLRNFSSDLVENIGNGQNIILDTLTNINITTNNTQGNAIITTTILGAVGLYASLASMGQATAGLYLGGALAAGGLVGPSIVNSVRNGRLSGPDSIVNPTFLGIPIPDYLQINRGIGVQSSEEEVLNINKCRFEEDINLDDNDVKFIDSHAELPNNNDTDPATYQNIINPVITYYSNSDEIKNVKNFIVMPEALQKINFFNNYSKYTTGLVNFYFQDAFLNYDVDTPTDIYEAMNEELKITNGNFMDMLKTLSNKSNTINNYLYKLFSQVPDVSDLGINNVVDFYNYIINIVEKNAAHVNEKDPGKYQFIYDVNNAFNTNNELTSISGTTIKKISDIYYLTNNLTTQFGNITVNKLRDKTDIILELSEEIPIKVPSGGNYVDLGNLLCLKIVPNWEVLINPNSLLIIKSLKALEEPIQTYVNIAAEEIENQKIISNAEVVNQLKTFRDGTIMPKLKMDQKMNSYETLLKNGSNIDNIKAEIDTIKEENEKLAKNIEELKRQKEETEKKIADSENVEIKKNYEQLLWGINLALDGAEETIKSNNEILKIRNVQAEPNDNIKNFNADKAKYVDYINTNWSKELVETMNKILIDNNITPDLLFNNNSSRIKTNLANIVNNLHLGIKVTLNRLYSTYVGEGSISNLYALIESKVSSLKANVNLIEFSQFSAIYKSFKVVELVDSIIGSGGMALRNTVNSEDREFFETFNIFFGILAAHVFVLNDWAIKYLINAAGSILGIALCFKNNEKIKKTTILSLIKVLSLIEGKTKIMGVNVEVTGGNPTFMELYRFFLANVQTMGTVEKIKALEIDKIEFNKSLFYVEKFENIQNENICPRKKGSLFTYLAYLLNKFK